MEPHWLMVVSWIALALGFGSALVILVDEFMFGHRQHMAVMNLVHPITALYWGPVWLGVYFRNGRKSSHKVMHEQAMRFDGDVEELKRKGESTDAEDLRPWHIGNAVSHCGAGCTLGDIGGEWILFAIFASPVLGITGTYIMQAGMIVGYFTAWPVNRWLVQSGIKEKMDHRKHLATMVEHMRSEQGDTARGERPHASVRTSARAEGRRPHASTRQSRPAPVK